jgi:hypothetical protein
VRRYPIEPLMALTGKTQFALLEGRRVNSETWSNIRDRGFTPQMADKVACANGFHPSLVWPSWEQDEFDELSVACKGCETLFIPKRKGQKFCTHPCGHRYRERVRRRKRYATDPEYAQKRRDDARAYYEEAKRAKQLYRRVYYLANKEKEAARQKAYDARNRERVNAARRARYRRQKDAAA